MIKLNPGILFHHKKDQSYLIPIEDDHFYFTAEGRMIDIIKVLEAKDEISEETFARELSELWNIPLEEFEADLPELLEQLRKDRIIL